MSDLKPSATNYLPLFGLLVLILFGFAFMVGNRTPAPQVTSNQTAENSPNQEDKNVEIEAGAFYYNPNTITVKKGQKVKVTLKSVDMMHNFYIDELNVKSETTKSGETASFEFIADKSGTFEYYCAVGQHRQNGQIGKLIVEE